MTALIGIGVAALAGLDPARKSTVSPKPVAATKAQIELLGQQDGEIVVEWTCPEIRLETDEVTGRITGIDMDGTSPCFKTGVPRLPKLTQVLDCLPGRVEARIASIEVESRVLGDMAATPEDVFVDPPQSDEEGGRTTDESLPPLSWRERSELTPLLSGLWPPEMVTVEESGVFRGHRLMALSFYPVQVDAEKGIARVARRVRIRVSVPRGETSIERLPDRPKETELLRRMLGTLAPTALPTRMPEAFAGRDSQRDRLDDDPIGGRWKLFVNRRGIVKVTADSLSFYGCPVDQISTYDLHIKNRGRELPIHFSGGEDGRFDPDDFIEFYGMPNQQNQQSVSPTLYTDIWTDQNVYWLSWGDGQVGSRLGQEDGSWKTGSLWQAPRVRTVSNVRVSYHYEQDWSFDRLPYSSVYWGDRLQTDGPTSIYEDHWFYGDRIDALTSRDFWINIPHPDTRSLGRVAVRVALQGFNWSLAGQPYSGHHRVVVRLSGYTAPGLSIGKVYPSDSNVPWVNQTAVILQSDSGIATQNLRDGQNAMSVFVTGDGLAGTLDKVLANWFEVEYDRALIADEHFLEFPFDTTREDTFAYDIRGFFSRNVEVWKVGESRLTNLDVRTVAPPDETPTWAVRFQLISNGPSEILAFDEYYPQSPLTITPERGTRDLRQLTGAEYLIIYHDSFANDLSLLLLDSLRRASFNGSVDTFAVSEIYEQFNHGIIAPEPIREFLKYAYEHWPVRPTHVCLVGDGMLTNKGRDLAGYLIPSFYPPSLEYGVAAADMLLGEVSGPPWDMSPDIAVGRISCRTPEELQTYVEKVVRYEDWTISDYNSPYHSVALFVSDARDYQFNFDVSFSEPIVRVMPDDVNVRRVYVDSLPSGQAPNYVRDAFRDGAIVVNYNGHGGGGQWSGTNLMTSGGVTLLNNRQAYPFITNFTCYVGAYDVRYQGEILGESFLFSRNSRGDPVGAVGVYSATGPSWANAGSAMQNPLYDFICVPPGLTFGEIVQINKVRYWALQISAKTSFSNYMAMQTMMTLLGDPGVTLRIPQHKFTTLASDTAIVSLGDTLRLSGVLPWDPEETNTPTYVYAIPYNGEYYRYVQDYYDSTSQQWIYDTVFISSKVPAFDWDLVLPQVVRTQVFDSLLVPIVNQRGHAFTTRRGRVVVYAADPGRDDLPARDVIGSVPIFHGDSLTGLHVYNLSVLPYGFIFNDSTFAVQADMMHPASIERVRTRGVFRPAQGPVVLDTVEMYEVQPGRWRTPLLGPYYIYGGAYAMRLQVKPFGGDFLFSDEYNLRLQFRPDFSIPYDSVIATGLRPGTRQFFYMPVGNSHSTNALRVPEMFVSLNAVHDSASVITDSFTTRVRFTDLFELPSLIEAWMPAPLWPQSYRITVQIDPDNLVDEQNEANNVYTRTVAMPHIYPATNLLGSYLPRLTPPSNVFHTFWTPGTKDTIFARLLPGSLSSDSATLIYSGPDTLSSADLSLALAAGLKIPSATVPMRSFRVTLNDGSTELASGGRVQVGRDFAGLADSLLIPQLFLFGRRESKDLWRKLDSTRVIWAKRDTTYVNGVPVITFGGRLQAEAEFLGEFIAFRFIDASGPDIELAVGGLRFTPYSLVPRHPEIYATMVDLAGIDRRPGKFYMVLDGDTVRDADIAWSTPEESAGRMSALIRPTLDPGQHVLYVKATNSVGVSDTLQVEFEVRGEFGFEWAVNYPNPFAKTTRISFALTDATDDFVEVKIYTVAGRHIRTLREQDRMVANYREITWDGEDERGDEVANGVYFARLKAKQGDNTVEKIVKMAKVR